VYDVSGATGAIYTDAAHTEFTVSLNGVLIEGARALPGLLLFDAMLANEIPIADYVPPPITSVTPRQARLALLSAGLLDAAQAAVDAADPATKITWEYASVFEREDPMILAIGAGLGLTSEQIDTLFTNAAGI
jgi:hypothetical protein